MKRSWLIRLKEKLVSRSSKPWACFETSGPSAEGRIEFSISWNTQFIKQLRAAGFEADTEEAMVQMFFVSARLIPEQSMLPDIDEDVVNPEEMPRLTSDANILRK
jgi:hypothetical protein